VVEVRSTGGDAMSLSLDVRATLTIEDAIATVASHFGRLDVLINNAGTQVLKPALALEDAEFDEVLHVNLKGAFLCAQAAARIMTGRGGGCIVNVASQHGVVGNYNRAAYSASKGGLISLTRSLAVEWARYRIRVNAISPTFVRTDTNGQFLDLEPQKAQIQQRILMGRPASCEEVAAGILFLSSPAAGMVTGHNLLIDGGWTAH
jgi:NAD(P)-dependent dehydrogenase (short-subunit alcohol dehydrogenase family)